MIILTTKFQPALCQMQHKTGREISILQARLLLPGLSMFADEDKRSLELLEISFAIKTVAYKRLAQGLSRSVSAFSSFMREYLEPVVKADQCAQ